MPSPGQRKTLRQEKHEQVDRVYGELSGIPRCHAFTAHDFCDVLMREVRGRGQTGWASHSKCTPKPNLIEDAHSPQIWQF